MREELGDEALSKDMAMLAAIVFVCFLNLNIWSMLSDGDTGWHIAAGAWMLDHRTVPNFDPFSFTFAGQRWVPHEWLSEVLMAVVYRLGGWSALSLFFASAVTGMFLMLGIHLRRWMPSLQSFIVLMAVFLLLQPYLLARPHLLALPIMAGWTIALLRARDADRAPPWPIAAIMILWANMHGSFLFGLLLIGPFALEAVIDSPGRRLQVFLSWGGFGLLALLAALITPHGIHGIIFPLQVSMMSTLPLILEWQGARFDSVSGFEIVLLGFLFFALSRGLRMTPIRLALLIVMLHLSLQHIRHQSVLAVVGALILAEPIGRAMVVREQLPKPTLREAFGGEWRPWAPAVLGMLLLLSSIALVRLLVPMQRPDSENVPMAAMERLPEGMRDKPVFNNYGFGGTLVLNGVRPYVDGRADMYGDAFVKEYARISSGNEQAWQQSLRRWKFRWTFLSPRDGLVKLLDRQAGWRRIYADKWAVIHVATDEVKAPGLPAKPAPAADR
jgi:hypothetical protein